MHEIGHALGLYHEQSHPKRDRYVTINFDNVVENRKSQFDKEMYTMQYGVPYDYLSIMHYGRTVSPSYHSELMRTFQPPSIHIFQLCSYHI